MFQEYFGTNSLMVAAKLGNIEITKLLLENGAKVNLEDRFGKTALATAKKYGNQSVANEIIQHKVKANRKSEVIKIENESSSKTDKKCFVENDENDLNSALKMSQNEFIKV